MKKYNVLGTTIKKYIKHSYSAIKVKYLSLSFPKQMVLIGGILGVISLFFPWIVDSSKEEFSWNAFSSLCGNIGFFLFCIYMACIFLVFSTTYKQKIKLYSGLNISHHIFLIIFGLMSIMLSIVVISFAVGLQIFGQYVNYEKGPIFGIITGILITLGGIYIRMDAKKNTSEIILEEMSKQREEKQNHDTNMELPI